MKDKAFSLIDKLAKEHTLTLDEYKILIDSRTPKSAEYAATLAVQKRQKIYGNKVYIRGLIEVGNICKNDCLYCGIRRSNERCDRYRLNPEEILECALHGYELGFRTFVLQGGEDGYFTDALLCELIEKIKTSHPDVAVTLSLGERTRESYENLRKAGADRYLLRHETANKEHYEKLHPSIMSYDNRIRCLYDLKELGYQVGCGFMVGSPYQTSAYLAYDLKFIEEFSPDMCGIGPFIPQKDTPFGKEAAGGLELTLYLLSLIRLIHPHLLLPSTTALGTIHERGREMGILAGANVVMPNLSPSSVRKKYVLYDNKISDGSEAAECLDELSRRMKDIGYEIAIERGDVKK